MSSNTPPFASGYNPPPTAGARKVAIPRLQRTGQAQNPKDRRRVPRACTACRSHKIKCSGDTPLCKHCEATGRECVYIMPRKDRLKIVTERCVQMAGVLNDLRSRANEEDSARISELLDAVEEDISDIRQPQVPSNPDHTVEDSPEGSGTLETASYEPLDPLNNDSLDLVDEDLLKDERARATGFVGKNSEVQWLRAIVLQLERTEDESAKLKSERRPSYAPSNIDQVSSFSFYADNESIDPDFYVAPYELPAPDVAERLLDCYMSTVHDSFPILPRKLFEDQFRRYFKAVQSGSAPRLSPRWQAILNLVFAIGAKYSHLTKASWRGDERDHIMYQARARKFGLSENALTNHPDVPQIQVAGLLAFYYLSVGQISRSWVILGTSLRFAYSLGLHVRNEDPSATATKREMLVRIWWSLYSLERLLSVATGRPSIIVDSCCSVPMPVPLSEDQIADDAEAVQKFRRPSTPSTASSAATSPALSNSFPGMETPRTPTGFAKNEANSGSYFRAVIQIGIISQNILSSLYTAGTMIRSPTEIQQYIAQLGQRLDQWLSSLPSEFNFQTRRPGAASGRQSHLRERILLGFHFYSCRILLTRPCLGSSSAALKEGKEAGIPGPFIRRMATICIESAKTVADFLPDQPNPTYIYEYGPWWSIVHHLMQTFSIYLLGLLYSMPMSQETVVLLQYSRKVVRWLRAMQDPLSIRAYHMAMRTLDEVAGRLSLDISDFWVEHAMAFPGSDIGMADATSPDEVAFLGGVGPMVDSHLPSQYVATVPMSTPTPVSSMLSSLDTRTSVAPPFPPQAGGHFFDDSTRRGSRT